MADLALILSWLGWFSAVFNCEILEPLLLNYYKCISCRYGPWQGRECTAELWSFVGECGCNYHRHCGSDSCLFCFLLGPSRACMQKPSDEVFLQKVLESSWKLNSGEEDIFIFKCSFWTSRHSLAISRTPQDDPWNQNSISYYTDCIQAIRMPDSEHQDGQLMIS